MIRALVGLTALVSCLLYIASDAMELFAGGFSRVQLFMTYIAFLAVPFYVLGFHALQGPRAGGLSLAGAVAYGAAHIFYAGTAIHALAARTADYAALIHEIGALYTLHGLLLVVGGVLVGIAIVRAGVLPRWTGLALLLGSLVSLGVAVFRLPDVAQMAGSTIRSAAFIGMAIATLRARPCSS